MRAPGGQRSRFMFIQAAASRLLCERSMLRASNTSAVFQLLCEADQVERG
jgi:hypothetical protein